VRHRAQCAGQKNKKRGMRCEVYGTRYTIFLSFGVSLRSLTSNESEKSYKGLSTRSPGQRAVRDDDVK